MIKKRYWPLSLLGPALLIVVAPGCADLEEGTPRESCVVVDVFARDVQGEAVPVIAGESDCEAFEPPTVLWMPFDEGQSDLSLALESVSFADGPQPGCRWRRTPTDISSHEVALDKGTFRVLLESFAPGGAPPVFRECIVEVSRGCFVDGGEGDVGHELTFFYGEEGCCFDGVPFGMDGPTGAFCPSSEPGLEQPCQLGADGDSCSEGSECCSGECEDDVCVGD